MNRICAGLPHQPCTRVTDKRRCPDCERAYQLKRERRTKGNYDTAWRRLVERAKREHPWCGVCGTPGTPGNPLTGDHIIPRAHGGRNERSNVAVLCRGCNSRKGSRLLSNP